jgi:hypothetical protein
MNTQARIANQILASARPIGSEALPEVNETKAMMIAVKTITATFVKADGSIRAGIFEVVDDPRDQSRNTLTLIDTSNGEFRRMRVDRVLSWKSMAAIVQEIPAERRRSRAKCGKRRVFPHFS